MFSSEIYDEFRSQSEFWFNSLSDENLVKVKQFYSDQVDISIYVVNKMWHDFANRDRFCQNICDLIYEKPLLKHIENSFAYIVNSCAYIVTVCTHNCF